MSELSDQIAELLAAADAAAPGHATGVAYEQLLLHIFGSVDGTIVQPDEKSHYGTEQVDIAVSHGGVFPGVPNKFLVECKNYAHPVDSRSVGYFLYICVSRACELAVVVAANGLTGNPDDDAHAHSLAKAAAALKCLLILITTQDLLQIETPQDVITLVSRRYLTAFAKGGIGTG